MDFVTFSLAVVYQIILIIMLQRTYWHLLEEQMQYGGGAFHFTLSDCWAASLGLYVSVGLVAYYLEDHDPYTRDPDGTALWVIFVGFMGITSQLAGAMIAVAGNVSPARGCRKNGGSFWQILVGSIFGLLLPVVGPVLLWLNYNEKKQRQSEFKKLLKSQQRRNERLRQVHARTEVRPPSA